MSHAPRPATVFAPASLSNLGPGFDTLGMALRGIGDRVTATLSDAPGVRVAFARGGEGLPTDPALNTAARAAEEVLRLAGAAHGLDLLIDKGIPVGSGIGGSAASAAAGAWAANAALGLPFAKTDLLGAVLEGERLASGSLHGDNALPALLGGLVMVSPERPDHYRRVDLPPMPPIALVLPHVSILTREARAILPAEVPFATARAQPAHLAFLLDALRAGDWAEAGHHLMQDALAEPYRARLLPCYEAVRRAALEAGAAGCAITGSGPAMFALTHSADAAPRVLDAMLAAAHDAGIDADGWLTGADPDGAAVVPPGVPPPALP
jgi:homoserine kinase